MTGIIFIDASLVRRRMSRRRFTAGATGMLAVRAVPSIHQARGQATPEPSAEGPSGGPDSLKALLSVVPYRLITVEDGGISFFYADLARQFASLGLDQEQIFINTFLEGIEEPAIFRGAISPLAIASDAFTNALNEEYTGFIGFQPLLVEHVLLTGTPPDQLSLFQGGIDLGALPDAWEASGYERKTADNGTEIWTIGEEGEIDTSRDLFINPAFNNATVLDSGIVMFGQMFDTVVEAAGLETSGGESSRDDPSIAVVVSALPDTTVSAIGVTPRYLDFTSPGVSGQQQTAVQAELEEGDVRIGEMPEWSALILGITGGFSDPAFSPGDEGTPAVVAERHASSESSDGAIMVRLVTGSEEYAAAADIFEKRWNSWNSAVSNRPLTELMAVKDARAEGEGAVINFTPVKAPSVWIDLVLQRDLLPFAFEMSPGDESVTPDD